jgi:hypothetical protein
MPNINSGNTNAPTNALARHATAILVEDLKRTLSRAIEIKSEVGIGTAVRMMLLPVSRPADGNSDDLSNSIATF